MVRLTITTKTLVTKPQWYNHYTTCGRYAIIKMYMKLVSTLICQCRFSASNMSAIYNYSCYRDSFTLFFTSIWVIRYIATTQEKPAGYLLGFLTLQPWRWRLHVTPKYHWICIRPDGVTFQKTVLLTLSLIHTPKEINAIIFQLSWKIDCIHKTYQNCKVWNIIS
jgi:hypothetical protein